MTIKFNQSFNRRNFLEYGTLGLASAGLGLPVLGQSPSKQDSKDPHFMLILFARGGLDSTYLFDARSLDQVKAKLQTNYFKNPEEPKIWTGVNGGQTKVTPLVSPLEKYRPYFSVLNGVLMADSFDGHEQNINLALTGNAFGGEWFAPFINSHNQYSLDALTFLGNIFADFPTNGQSTLSLSPQSLMGLAPSSGDIKDTAKSDPLLAFSMSRAAAVAKELGPHGRLAQGAQQMQRGILESSALKTKISSFKASSKPGIVGLVESSMQAFAAGITQTVVLSLDRLPFYDNFDFDVHGEGLAAQCPVQYEKLIQEVAKVFDLLLKTPVPGSQQSFMDVTTVMVLSDFDRTTRQLAKPLDKSGTDHNPLSNSILLGGKGIKGGMILGATDLDTIKGQTYGSISKAHKSLDPELIKKMGKPFDTSSLKVLEALPATYVRTQYLTIENVINTVLKNFGVTNKDHYRLVAGTRSGNPATTLDKLLT